MDSAAATCLKAAIVPLFLPPPCPSNVQSQPLPSHWDPVFESCSLSRLTELKNQKREFEDGWELVTIKKKKEQSDGVKGRRAEGEHKEGGKRGGCIV